MRKKRRAGYSFRVTLRLCYPLRPRLPLRQDQETPSPVTFLSYSERISSSSCSSVRSSQNRSNKKRHSRAWESNLF